MYWFFKLIEYSTYLSVIGIMVVFALSAIRGQRDKTAYSRHKERVGSVPTYEHENEAVKDVREAQRASLDFMGLPSIHAGRTVLNIPSFNPEKESGWEANRTVITTSRITALLKQGAVPGDLIEFDGGYALFGTNGKVFLFQNHLLTGSEESQLERERQEAVEKGDAVIPNFQGLSWQIRTACGSHNACPGEKSQSKVQVLSVHPELGKNGIASCLPPNLLDRREHDYYDMRARSSDERVMFFFFAGGKWNCFIGRELDANEKQRLQAL